MKKFLLVFFSLLLVFKFNESNASEPTPTHESVKELLTLASFPEIINNMMIPYSTKAKNDLNDRLKKEITSKHLDSKQEILLKNEVTNILKQFDDFYSWKTQEVLTIEIYSKNFNQKEINDLITFAKTKTGQSFWKKNNIIINQSARLGEQNGIKFMNEQNKKITSLIMEINK